MPTKVAILGGGCAALTAAFELSRPELMGRYQITVYQMGWRLGGKGASGRGLHDRIEEHGLHLWLGFYENSFRLMRECYQELERDPDICPIATWQDAFKPAPDVAVVDRMPSGDWLPWVAHFPPGKGLPGDSLEQSNPFTIQGYLQQAASLVWELIRSAENLSPSPTNANTIDALERVLRYGQLATAAALFEAADILKSTLSLLFSQPALENSFLRLIETLSHATRSKLESLVAGDIALARVWQVVDLVLTILRGAIVDRLAFDPRGFDAIDDVEWMQWLSKHGALEQSLNSGFLRGIYDLVFAYDQGDVQRPRLAASVALRGSLRMFFTYRGALFWRMSAGMGDIVFAPLYEVLKKRGVNFKFFHRLQNIGVEQEADGTLYIKNLQFDIQANVKKDEYQPLKTIHDLPCWPASPDWEQLEDGDTLKNWQMESPWEKRIAGQSTLHLKKDFDLVVLGLGLAALPMVSSELAQYSFRWKQMLEQVQTVATQAAQLWLSADRTQLGWPYPSINLSGWVEPFDTWADMSHLIPQESQADVRSIAYFCSPLPDAEGTGEDFHAVKQQEVYQNLQKFLAHDVQTLWPGAHQEQQFRWELLVPPQLSSQFWQANVRPSDRYTLSVPGSQKFRISPLETICDNLTIAGDWTASGLNSGCVESAVMSGMLAAHALSLSPPLSSILGYDHP